MGDSKSISVVSMGSVGPYDYTTIAVDPQLPDAADAAIEWFRTNGYDLSGVDAVVLGPYLDEGLNLLAFKLTKSAAESSGAQYEQLIWSDTDQTQWEMIRNQSYPDGIDAIWAANNYYRGWEGWRDAIEASVTLPQGASFDEFGRNPDGFRGTAQVDTQEFFAALLTKVIEPVAKTQELLVSRPYLTRMFSTMSADEMTMDPAFGYNSDLAPVSNIHKAKQYIECSPNVSQYEAPWRIELPQGGVIRGTGGYEWPIEVDGALPANLKIVQLSTSGAGEVVTDNSSVIGEALFKISKMVGTGEMKPQKPMSGVPIGGEQTVRVPSAPAGDHAANANGDMGSDSDCAVSAPGSARASWLTLALLGAAAWLAARRRTRS
jgi:hypothetical protein